MHINRLMVLVLIVMAAGCSTMATPPLYTSEHFPMQKESEGIQVSLEIVKSKDKVEKYFGTDLLAAGIVPFYVQVVNTSKDSSILVDEHSFSLQLGAKSPGLNTNNKIKNSTEEASQMSTAATAGIFVTPLILMPILPAMLLESGKMVTDASVVNYVFNRNKLWPTTLSPGRSIRGFVYFKLPAKEVMPDRWNMDVTIKHLSDDKNTTFQF
jgi:hypothetical protein